MDKKSFLIALICCTYISGFGQTSLFSGKIRQSRSNSFYSYDHYKNDYNLPETQTFNRSSTNTTGFRRNIKNLPNNIIENLENPPKTIVLDGNKELEELKALMNEPEKILIDGNFAEFPYAKGQTLYRIPVNLETNHHVLTDPLVQNELSLYLDDCVMVTGQIPGSVVLEHNEMISSCEFLSFKSVSNLYSKPYYQQRLNLSCVFINKLIKDFYCYANKSKAGSHIYKYFR